MNTTNLRIEHDNDNDVTDAARDSIRVYRIAPRAMPTSTAPIMSLSLIAGSLGGAMMIGSAIYGAALLLYGLEPDVATAIHFTAKIMEAVRG